jgi:predicted helicase
MTLRQTIKPTHRAIKAYYETLAGLSAQPGAGHEMAVRQAFQTLLSDTARGHGWTLITEIGAKVEGKTIRPDGTLRDANSLPRGWWEAKDPRDDLDRAITIKTAKGYPLSNTIFENARRAVLFQGGQKTMAVDLSDPGRLCDVLNQFYDYADPPIADFETAIGEFKERVPELARGLADKIREAHQNNPRFITAYGDFFRHCQNALNPNIRRDAVDEMLIQHLLTQRLFTTVFDNPDFVQKNAIAVEVEKVASALVSKSFSRTEFLRSLDRFYVAIERAAQNLRDFSDKQHFLNTVYERFFQGYCVKVADTHGIVYTPQPIVDFMCASVAEVLKSEFGKSLSSPDVHILDPCVGTGNFIVNLMRRMPKRDLPRMYRRQMFANEVMLLPYYISALNIEHAYYELTGEYEAFEGLCFVDTLDLADVGQRDLIKELSEKNAERVEREKGAPITVILGNPPYNVGQLNENDNNKNRKYELVEKRVHDTYAHDSTATNKNALSDAYVKFFRWATDRLGGRDGIVCFVSNNSFIDNIAFDGMREHLARDFTRIYHADLHGNVRRNPKLSGTTHNVFGIQVGVGITVAVRVAKHISRKIFYHRVVEDWRKEEKYRWLAEQDNVTDVQWESIQPDAANTWLTQASADEFSRFLPIGSKVTKSAEQDDVAAIFKLYGRGLETTRDAWVYNFGLAQLQESVRSLVQTYNSEVDRWKRAGRPSNVDDFVLPDERKIKWSSRLKETLVREVYAEYRDSKIRVSLYRPFSRQFVFFDSVLNQRRAVLAITFPTQESENENRVICVPGLGGRAAWATIITDCIPNLCLTSIDGFQCFPFYVYDEDGGNRRENITDWALALFREHYGSTISPQVASAASAPLRLKKELQRRDAEDAEKKHAEKGTAQRRGAEPAEQSNAEEREITKWDIFYYVYGILHHPGYREKFSDCLKRELPRIPLAEGKSKKEKGKSEEAEEPKPRAEAFWAFSDAGRKLADLHLDYEKIEPWPLEWIETPGVPLSFRVEDKMRLSKDKTSLTVNPSLRLGGIPAECFDYRLGNRSALEWVVDQYRVKEDPRSGIRSDPNRAEDPEYIVRLVGQVVRVSVETVGIVKGLPRECSGQET